MLVRRQIKSTTIDKYYSLQSHYVSLFLIGTFLSAYCFFFWTSLISLSHAHVQLQAEVKVDLMTIMAPSLVREKEQLQQAHREEQRAWWLGRSWQQTF
jgi:hypothetical protein